MTAMSYDVVVLGGGPVGENLAQYAIEGTSLTAAIVEGELLGGECSYYACMPSKALLRPIEVAASAADLGGLTTAEVRPDDLLRRRDAWVSHYDDHGQAEWAESAGIDLVRGHGRLTGERRVTVNGPDGVQELTARVAVVLATGSTAVVPDLFLPAIPWTSRDATGVVEIPDRLAIVGGGVVACEAATWLSALGSQVTLLVRGDRLLERCEPFAGDAVRDSLQRAGIDVRTQASVVGCTRPAADDTGLGRIHGGTVRLELNAADGGHSQLEVDEVLVATGRRPRLDDVGLDSVGLDREHVLAGALPEWLWAVGDASGEAPLTHWGKYRARVLGERISALAEGRPVPFEPSGVPVPQVVFTDPQVAAVGQTEAEAREAGVAVVTTRVPYNSAAGAALLRDHVAGEAQLVVDSKTGTIVGATFVGPEVAELLQAATIAILGRVPVSVLRHAVPSYPTASEIWLRLLEALPRELRTL